MCDLRCILDRRYSLTPEGAAVVTTVTSPADSEAGESMQRNGIPPTTVSSGHIHCPPSLGCREGRIPDGWVATRGGVVL